MNIRILFQMVQGGHGTLNAHAGMAQRRCGTLGEVQHHGVVVHDQKFLSARHHGFPWFRVCKSACKRPPPAAV
jgi:hypothetical protein